MPLKGRQLFDEDTTGMVRPVFVEGEPVVVLGKTYQSKVHTDIVGILVSYTSYITGSDHCYLEWFDKESGVLKGVSMDIAQITEVKPPTTCGYL